MCPDAASWSDRYLAGNTPWDHGAPHPELERLIEEGALAPPRRGVRALVPGCGRGHDALALAAVGWSVTAIDFAPEASEGVGPALASQGGEVLLEDALAHEPSAPYDLLWEHTFFCAIEPKLRPRYGEMAARVLRPGARLVALVFPVGKGVETGGPPWGTSLRDLESALAPGFLLRGSDEVLCPIAERSWREELAVFERSALL
jgi:SAM-dependent methyltransferase